MIVSQLHLAFLKFHNAVVDRLLDDGATNPNVAFDEVQRLVRWHYQWIILHEFLPATVGPDQNFRMADLLRFAGGCLGAPLTYAKAM